MGQESTAKCLHIPQQALLPQRMKCGTMTWTNLFLVALLGPFDNTACYVLRATPELWECGEGPVWIIMARMQAFGNLLRRMIEASGRGIWNADSDLLDKLKSMYGDLDDELEGV